VTFLQTRKDTTEYRFFFEISSIRSSPPPLLLTISVPYSPSCHPWNTIVDAA